MKSISSNKSGVWINSSNGIHVILSLQFFIKSETSLNSLFSLADIATPFIFDSWTSTDILLVFDAFIFDFLVVEVLFGIVNHHL